MSLIRGNALAVPLADESVDLIVTSPPYFALRSYTDSCGSCGGRVGQAGTGDKRTEAASTGLQGGKQPSFKENANRVDPDPDCPDCNGTGRGHYDGQIGSEATPAEFIAALLEVTRECERVLKPSGSLWVNLGDKYAAGHGGSSTEGKGITVRKRSSFEAKPKERPDLPDPPASWGTREATGRNVVPGFRPKSLMGMPWRYALACIDDLGLILRAEVIWSKPNGLPESVQDRVRRSHENWFHFTKEPRYFSAVDEIREPSDTGDRVMFQSDRGNGKSLPSRGPSDEASVMRANNPLGKLPGSVWTVPTEPLRVPDHLPQHFAAFPSEWPKRIILGWSPSGICVECGEGRRPVVATSGLDESRPQARRALELVAEHGLTDAHIAAVRSVGVSDTGRGAATQTGTGKNTAEVYALADEARKVLGGYAREFLLSRPTSLTDACDCPTPDAPTHPAIVLDPFAGTGTTVAVANALGRHGIGLDLSADYLKLARWRCQDPGLRAKVLGVDKPKPETAGQLSLMEAS